MPTQKSSAGGLEEFQPAMFDTPELDEYGGYTERQFEPTGYFRLEKYGRWWLVTPEGNAFLSFGLNHVRPGRLMPDNMVEFWRERFDADRTTVVDFVRDADDAGTLIAAICHGPSCSSRRTSCRASA